jgi:diacylglycerol kinase (ATP)
MLPASARSVLVSVNPRAGARSRQGLIDELCRQLVELGLVPTLATELDELRQQSAALLASGQLRAVVAAGGDGTVRLVAEHTPLGTPLAVLPLGTENLLARQLEIAANPWQIARLIADGWAGRFDAGQATHGGPDEPRRTLFLLMAGCGFDADVVRHLHHSRRGHIHHLSYAKPILDAIRKYEYPALRVYCESDGQHDREIEARWAFVVNLPRYAGGLSFAPAASATDGLLDVCTFKEGSLWYGLMYLGGVVLGQQDGMQDYVRVQTRRVRIESAGCAPFQLDGDPGGDLPIEIEALPGRLTLLVGRAWAVKQGLLLRERVERLQ